MPRPDFVSARRKTTANWPVPLRTAARSNSRRTGYSDSEVHLLLDGLLLFEINQQPVAEAGPGAIFDPAMRTRYSTQHVIVRAKTPCRLAVLPRDQLDSQALLGIAAKQHPV